MGWYKDKYFWRKPTGDGSNGKGDLIFNTCNRVIEQGDDSEWAYKAVESCRRLLVERQRWPAGWVHPLDAKSWPQRVFNRLRNKLIGYSKYPFRYRGRMTRDPYIAWFTACVLLKVDYHGVKLPWYCYSPATHIWVKYLKTKDIRYYFKYLLWDFPNSKAFVKRLEELRLIAANVIKDSR